ncbi:MAG TPA: hypothetical protein PKN75_03130 [Bacteroidia bacterium]|nr:hypothetical protein [Bacteroidia bacterium]
MKRGLLVIFLFAVKLGWAQTPSNDCSTALGQQHSISTSCSYTSWDINTGIGSPALSNCSGSNSGSRDGWSWFNGNGSTVTVSYDPPNNRNAAIYIYTDGGTACTGLTQVACADAGGDNFTETVNISTTAGTRYYVRIVRRSGSGGTMGGQICVWSCPAPSNDNPCGATSLTVNTSCTLSSYTLNSCATSSSVANPSCNNTSVNDIWYSLTVPSSGRITFQTTAGTITDADMALYSVSGGCSGTFTQLYCDDDSGPSDMPQITASNLTPGSIVYLRVWARNNGQTGTYNLCAFDPCSSSPGGNDNPCGATSVTVGTSCTMASYTLPSCAYPSAVANPTCNNISVYDVWYSATVPASGMITIQTSTGGVTDLDMALYSATACAGVFTQLYCDDNTGPGSMPEITASGLTAGSTVYIRVWARNNAQSGTFNMCAFDPCSTLPANDSPCGATSIIVGTSCSYSSYTLNTCATASGVSNPTCNNIAVNDIWFSAIVPASGNLNVTTTTGGITDLDLAIYSATACAGVFTQLYCDDNTGPGSMPEIFATSLTPGATVYIRAWARNNAQTGTFNMCVYAPCTPSNDDPCGATVIPVNASCSYSTYTNACATNTGGGIPGPGCASYNGSDVWFRVTVPASGTLQFDSREGDITDGGMAVYSATNCSTGFAVIACDDDASSNGYMPYLSLTGLTPGSTLYIRFWSYNNDESGTFDLCIYDPCAGGSPSNDDPCSAVVITPTTSCNYATYNNNCATATGGGIPAPGCANYVTGDIWFAVTVPASGGLTIDTKQGTLTDMGMALYSATACSGTYTLVACDDDASANGFMPYLSVTSLTPGDVVYIRMWDKDGNAQGTFDLCVMDPCPNGIPTNDLPCDAQELTIGVTLFGDNGCATSTSDPALPACWGGGNSNTVWYYIVCPASGTIRVRTYLGTLVDTQIALFSGTCSSLTNVACNDNATQCPGSTTVYYSEINQSGLTPGATYYLAVDGRSNYMGNFNIIATNGAAFPSIPQQDCIYPTLICNQITPVGNPGFTGAGNVCDYTTPYSCYGGGERNSVWYYFNIQNNGTLAFDITPLVSSTDYDFMLFNTTGISFGTVCSQISSQSIMPVRCNFSGTPGTTSLNASATGTHENATGPNDCTTLAVTAGQTYILLITNYSNNNTGFSLDFTPGSPLSYSSTPTTVVWTGGIDNDWFKPGNWGGCAIPSCTIDAVVVNGPVNQPVINGSGAVCKSLTINPGSSLTIQGNNTLQLCGDYTNNGDLSANTASTIYFGPGTATQGINGNLVGLSQFPNLRIQKTGGQVNLNQDIDIAGNMTVQSATSVFNFNGKYITLDGNFFNANGSTSIINPEGSTLEFDGLTAQTFNNGGGSLMLGSVKVDNKSTGITLSGGTSSINIGLTGTLDLNDGVIITATNNEVNVTNTAPSAVNSGNVNSYIRGRLRRSIGTTTGNYYLPVGNAAMGYELAEINYTIAPTSPYNLLATFSSWSTVPNGPISSDCSGRNYALKPALNHGYWTINASVSPASGTYNVTLNNQGYTNNSGTFWTVMKRSPSGSSGTWALDGTCNTSSTADVTIRQGLSGFSDFASIQWANPLPIELLSFYVEKADNAVSCKWTTVSEENNDYFTVERTMDKINFEEIGKVNGAGNSKEVNTYSYTDKNPLSGQSFYRIRQTDFNGHSTTTEWKSVDFNKSPSHLNLFPNPASKFINCGFSAEYKGQIEISVIDITQKELIRYRTEMVEGQNRIPISIESIPNGVYFIKLKSADSSKPYFEMSSKFIKGKGVK